MAAAMGREWLARLTFPAHAEGNKSAGKLQEAGRHSQDDTVKPRRKVHGEQKVPHVEQRMRPAPQDAYYGDVIITDT